MLISELYMVIFYIWCCVREIGVKKNLKEFLEKNMYIFYKVWAHRISKDAGLEINSSNKRGLDDRLSNRRIPFH